MLPIFSAGRAQAVAGSLLLIIATASMAAPASAAAEQGSTQQGSTQQGYLGVMLQDLTPSMAKALQLGDRPGVIVNDVVDDGPAAKAGLLDGDVILELNGKNVSDYAALTTAVRALAPGDKASMLVLRDGKQQKVEVEVGKRALQDVLIASPHAEQLKQLEGLNWLDDGNKRVIVLSDDDDAPRIYFHGDGEGDDDGDRQIIVKMMEQDQDRGWLGVHMDALNGQLGDYFGVKDGAGVLVTEVVAEGPAAAAGLLAGDVIVKAGDTDVTSPDALHEAMSGTKAGDDLALQVLRKGSRRTVSVKLGEMPADALAGRRIEINGDGAPGELRMFAPRMLRHLGPMGDGSGERQVIIERKGMAEEDLNGVHEEIEALRQEMKELREDLKR